MPTCFNFVRDKPEYRFASVNAGARALGYEVSHNRGAQPKDDRDCCVIWNRYGASDAIAKTFEAAGCAALVMENGYIPQVRGEAYYALGIGGHNGAGWHPVGDANRWSMFNVDLAPWHGTGSYVLLIGQRAPGYNQQAIPAEWPDCAIDRIKERSELRIVYRPHPSRQILPAKHDVQISDPAKTYLAYDLADASMTVVWTSNCGTESLIAGVPVWKMGPHTITESACLRTIDWLEPLDREPAFIRLAWAQWSIAEIERGDAFDWLLGHHNERRSDRLREPAQAEESHCLP